MAKATTSRSAPTITLNQLIAESSTSTVETFRKLDFDFRRFNPRIWVGIWIEPFGPGGDINIPGTGRG